LHLHGELTKARSTADRNLVYNIGYKDIKPGDYCEKGSQLRPHIVWFGEEVPLMDEAVKIVRNAEVFVVIGTSLNVYPAAGLMDYIPARAPIWVIDPKEVPVPATRNVQILKEMASTGVTILIEKLTRVPSAN
jgi:NAD-dependent deacetylase